MSDTGKEKRYVHTIEYMEAEIGITAKGEFEVVNEDGNSRQYESIGKAKEAVEEKLKRQAAMERKKVNLRCVDAKGKEFYVKGIHAGNGKMILTPNERERFGTTNLYVHTEAIKFALAAADQMDTRAADIRSALWQFTISEGRRSFEDRRDHAQKVTDLEKKYQEALAEAEKQAKTIIGWTNGETIPEKLRKKKIKL